MQDDAGRYLDQEAQILIHERHWATLEALTSKNSDAVSIAEVVEAVATVHHECTHALGPSNPAKNHGYSRLRDDTRKMEDRLAALFLEEATADVWTRHTLQQFILETGIDRLDPRLQRCAYDVRYLDLVSVLEAVILDIGKLAGPSFYDLTQLLAREVPDTRGERFAELVLGTQPQPDKTNPNPRQRIAEELERLFYEFDTRVGNGEDVGANAIARFAGLIVRR